MAALLFILPVLYTDGKGKGGTGPVTAGLMPPVLSDPPEDQRELIFSERTCTEGAVTPETEVSGLFATADTVSNTL